MPQNGYVIVCRFSNSKFGKQGVVAALFGKAARLSRFVFGIGRNTLQQALAVQRLQHGPAIGQCPDPVQAHGIEAFEYVAVFAMHWRMAVFVDKALDIFKTGNDALFSGGPRRRLVRVNGNAQRFKQVFV